MIFWLPIKIMSSSHHVEPDASSLIPQLILSQRLMFAMWLRTGLKHPTIICSTITYCSLCSSITLSAVRTRKATVHFRKVLVVLLLLLSRPYSSIVHVIVGLAASGCGVLWAWQATAEPVWQRGITAATTTANHFPTRGLYRWLGSPIIVT